MPDAPTILAVLWRASWQAGVLVLLVLALRYTLRDRLPAAWRSRLWGLVFLRLLLPVVPASPISLFNLLPADPPLPAVRWPTVSVVVQAQDPAPFDPTPMVPLPASEAHRSYLPDVLLAIWLGTAAALAIATVVAHVRFAQRVRRSQLTVPLEVADAWRAIANSRRVPSLVVTDAVSSPALFGLLRGRLLLPPNLWGRLSPAELRLVFLHELAHVRRRDLLVGWVAVLVRCVYWFHPLVWIAVAARRADAEAACDDAVVAATGDRLSYGRTLLAVAGGQRVPAIGMADGRTDLRRRLGRIATAPLAGRRSTVAAAMLTIAVGCATLTTGGSRPIAKSRPPAVSVTVVTRLARYRPRDLFDQNIYIPATAAVDVATLSPEQVVRLEHLAPVDKVPLPVPRVTLLDDGRPATVEARPAGGTGLSMNETLAASERHADGTVPITIDLAITRNLPARAAPPPAVARLGSPTSEVTRLTQTLFLKPGQSVLLVGRSSWMFVDSRPAVVGSETPGAPSQLEQPWTFVVVTLQAPSPPGAQASAIGSANPDVTVNRTAMPTVARAAQDQPGIYGQPGEGGPFHPYNYPGMVMAAAPPRTSGPFEVTPGVNGLGGSLMAAGSPPLLGTATPDGRGVAIPIPTDVSTYTAKLVRAAHPTILGSPATQPVAR